MPLPGFVMFWPSRASVQGPQMFRYVPSFARRRRLAIRLSLALLLTSAGATGAAAQQANTVIVVGTIVDSSNAPIAERFVFDPNGDRFTYHATDTDPTVLTRPCTITIPRRVTAERAQDGWSSVTFLATPAGTEPIIEAYERTCVEKHGNPGAVAVDGQ